MYNKCSNVIEISFIWYSSKIDCAMYQFHIMYPHDENVQWLTRPILSYNIKGFKRNEYYFAYLVKEFNPLATAESSFFGALCQEKFMAPDIS